jgi:hypothetical protein
VHVTYSDISNAAMLIEVARTQEDASPEPSFGTHFFQDLVEAGIRYLPLYPDDPDVAFQETFFRRAHNVLPDLLPDAAPLAEVVRVIDVARETGGKVLRILMNAELDEAVGALTPPAVGPDPVRPERKPTAEPASADHWRWRQVMAERLAAATDPGRFGVKAMYLIGSTKNATAGPGSDLDLIVHVEDDPARRDALALWLEGWSRSLAEVNYLRTGYRAHGLLDVHYVTDADLAAQTSFATKIGAVTDPARPLALGS